MQNFGEIAEICDIDENDDDGEGKKYFIKRAKFTDRFNVNDDKYQFNNMQGKNNDDQQKKFFDNYYINTDEDKFNVEADTRNFFNINEFNNNTIITTTITDNTETTNKSTENNTLFNTPEMAAYFNTNENI